MYPYVRVTCISLNFCQDLPGIRSTKLQAFLDFHSCDFHNFGFTMVYKCILFSSPLVLLSNLDLRGFCLCGFLFVSPHYQRNMPVIVQVLLSYWTYCIVIAVHYNQTKQNKPKQNKTILFCIRLPRVRRLRIWSCQSTIWMDCPMAFYQTPIIRTSS